MALRHSQRCGGAACLATAHLSCPTNQELVCFLSPAYAGILIPFRVSGLRPKFPLFFHDGPATGLPKAFGSWKEATSALGWVWWRLFWAPALPLPGKKLKYQHFQASRGGLASAPQSVPPRDPEGQGCWV